MKIPQQFRHNPYVGLIIGGIIGIAMTGNILGAVGLGILGALIQATIVVKSPTTSDDNKRFLKNEQDYLKSIIGLAAVIIRADGKEALQEIGFMEAQLRRNFSPEFVPIAMSHVRAELRQPGSLHTFCQEISMNFDNAAKIQLMHLLVGICAADSVMSTAERQKLFDIARRIEFSSATLNAIIGRFRFRTEEQQEQYETRTKKTDSQLENAYTVLGLTPTVSDPEIKKAYKKLALQHHPDKVAHQGEQLQKSAAEKFKTIAAAYDLICKKRGIV